MSEWDGPVIETASGRRLNLIEPSTANITIDDIATGLAHTCRFGGQCPVFYSVADHARYVSTELETPRMQLLGLFHDGAEAYLGDIPRPLKQSLPDIELIEQRLLDRIWDRLEIVPPTDDEWNRIMAVDNQLLAYEADSLLADGSWAGDAPDLEYSLDSTNPEESQAAFQQHAKTLLAEI